MSGREFYEYIKSYAKADEIEDFNDKAELVKKKLRLKKVVKRDGKEGAKIVDAIRSGYL